ncbi:hypothetical protein F383_13571 [Gossypium arboreum]|uniref:Uncharacterized protein n=1 Tax=Gossypium arboreum TaxID=29729 RepID=A0A0B0PX09_GOSAR|nr:hypothetical protein F383_13571 [Gossypium arboreum]
MVEVRGDGGIWGGFCFGFGLFWVIGLG